MTTFRTEFTKEDFLALPEFVVKTDVPKDKSPFLLKNSALLTQKDHLLEIIEQLSKANVGVLEEKRDTKEVLKIKYLIRHGDGNISELGGIIPLKTIINDLLPKATGVDANGVLTLDTVDPAFAIPATAGPGERIEDGWIAGSSQIGEPTFNVQCAVSSD
jgi:hypothetical protein